MASETREKMNELYPVREWDTNTVADGKLFTYSSVNPLANRDDYIADEFGKYQQQLATESSIRTNKDTELVYKANAEIQARKTADQNLMSDLAIEENKLIIHEAQRSEVEGSTDDAHLTKDSYNYLHDNLSLVTEPYLSQWASISALNGLTDETINLTGSKFIEVTATSDSDITIGYKNPDNEPIGEDTGVYLSNGEFLPATNQDGNKFGNAIVNFYCDDDNKIVSADSYTYINQSEIPITASEDIPTKNSKFVWGSRYTNLISDAAKKGANNFAIHIKSAGAYAQEHILFNVEDLEKFKMYTVNVVPECGVDTNSNYNINLTFSADQNKFINYSNDTYAAYTYGYLYNVPQFGAFNGAYSNEYEGTISLSATIDNKTTPVRVPLYANKNIIAKGTNQHPFNDARYDTFLNDGGVYSTRISNTNTMYTMQPHTKKSMLVNSDENNILYTNGTKTGKIDNVYGIGGHWTIKGKMMTLKSSFDQHIVYRRQISFMRGQDMQVKTSTKHEWDWQMYPSDSAPGKMVMSMIWVASDHKFIYTPSNPAKASTFDYEIMNFINTQGIMDAGITETAAINELNIRFKAFLDSSYYAEFWDKSKCYFVKKTNDTSYTLHLAQNDLTQTGYTIYFFSEATY